jgi:hypothetical protein
MDARSSSLPRQLVDPTAATIVKPFLHSAAPRSSSTSRRTPSPLGKQIRAKASGMTDEQALDLTRRATSSTPSCHTTSAADCSTIQFKAEWVGDRRLTSWAARSASDL